MEGDDITGDEKRTTSNSEDNVQSDEAVPDDIAAQVMKNLEAIRKKTSTMEAESIAAKEKQMANGEFPQPWPECRSYASMCVSSNRWLFVYGGRNASDKHLCDLWMFDLENLSTGWINLTPTTPSDMWPAARDGAILVPVCCTY